MGLDQDHLLNAVTIALTPHVALNKGVGTMLTAPRRLESFPAQVEYTPIALATRESKTNVEFDQQPPSGLW